jgi:hypothetical protein
MADLKISQLTGATTPLAGTEVLPIVQSSSTKKIATDDLTVKNVRSNATTGILQVAGPATAATRTMTVPDANFTAARTDAGQTFTGDQTLSTGNLVIGTSGKGIDFSDTPGTGTSELLADYEEGTFTPTLFYDTAGFDGTYTTQIGQYTKVGNLVTVLVVIGISSKGINSGDVQLRGLPFTFSATVNANNSGGNAVLLTGFNGTLFTLGFRGIAATSNCYLMKNNAGFTTTMTPADLQDAAGFSVTFSYLV